MYQFIHIESYAREAGKSKTGSNNVSKVIEEASRNKDFFPHIEQPAPPVHVFGIDIKEVEKEAFAWADASTDAKGRKLRKDGLCLLAGVFSVPDELSAQQWNDYKNDAVDWLKEKYGDRLRCVIEHKDESHRHCHFYCIPRPGEKFDDIHDGKRAYAEKRNCPKGQQNQAYKDAMRQFQEDFNIISRKYALSKIGPGRRRLTQAEYKAEKEQMKLLADMSNNKNIAIDQLKLQYKEPIKKQIQNHYSKKYKNILDEKTKSFKFLDIAKKAWHKPTKASEAKAYDLEELNKKLQKENEARIKEIADLQNNLEKTKSFSNDILKQSKNDYNELKKELTESKKLAIELEKQQEKQLEAIALNLGISVEEVKKLSEIEKIQAQQTRSKSPYKPF